MELKELGEWRLKSLVRIIAERAQEYYKDPEHRKEFEEWYLKKYGKPYVWKTLADRRREIEERKSNEYDNNESRSCELTAREVQAPLA